MTVAAEARGVEDLPTWVRQSWLIPFALGVVLLAAGAVLLGNLDAGVRTLRWLVVLDLLLAALQALATASLRSRPWVGAVVAVLYVVAALIGIVWPGVTLLVLVLTAGISLLLAGIAQAGGAWLSRTSASGWGWSFALGGLGVVAGLVLLLGNPVISLVALAIVLACYTFSAGATMVVLALQLRHLTGAIAGLPAR